MISGDFTRQRIDISVGATALEADTVTFDIRRGGQEFGPYRGGPDVGTAIINLYYAPGAAVPVSSFVVGARITFTLTNNVGTPYGDIFTGNLQDYSINYVIDNASGTFGQAVTLYAVDLVGYMQRVNVPGMITSRTTKNVSWETRMNTLSSYIPLSGGFSIPTSPESHVFRLVDNNLDAPLTDHLDLACNSVGATWHVNAYNSVQPYEKGEYAKTGILFSDEPGYWSSGNAPANSQPIPSFNFYNIEYAELDAGSDTGNLVNTVNVTNIIPRNMQTEPGTGALVYKDPETVRGPQLEVLEQPFTAKDSASVSTYGIRERDILTNVFPYRTTDTESYYIRFNAFHDTSIEYQSEPQITSSNAQVRFSTVNPQTGDYCLDVVTTASGSSFVLILGDPNGYELKRLPTANYNNFNVSWRTAQSAARFRRGIEYLDSNGNVIGTQTSALNTPTLNTWTTQVATFMNFATIPAGTVAWRPTLTVTHASSTFAAGVTIAKLDDISINPNMFIPNLMSGDTPDTLLNIFSWEGNPGESWSYQMRNVLDNVGKQVLDYWKEQKNRIRSITFNARQANWETLLYIEPGARVDVHFQGADFTAWINTIRYRADNENLIVTLNLSNRPASWI